MKQETLKTLEKLLIALAVMDLKKEAKEKIQNCLKEVKEEINYNRCCESDSEQLCVNCQCKPTQKLGFCNECFDNIYSRA